MKFPISYSTFADDEINAATDCLRRGQTTMGDKVREFEERFADYLGVTDAVMVNSGSSADLVMMLAAREMGYLRLGDEILLPAVTWPTQVWAAVEAGFKVKLVDVSTQSLNARMPVEAPAVFITHLMGNPTTSDNGGFCFEDCCEALGASVDGKMCGTFGKASAFSFFYSHHISTMEGGMVATSDPDFAECCRQLRAHGWVRDLKTPIKVKGDSRYHFTGRGFNFRPTELQGAIGLVQLRRLGEFNHWRNKNREFLHLYIRPENQNPVLHIEPATFNSHPAWFAMPFVLKENLPYSRADVFAYLASFGIETRPIVGGNIARQPAFSEFRKFTTSTLDNADVIHDRGFYIGLPPFQTDLWQIVGAFQGMNTILSGARRSEMALTMK